MTSVDNECLFSYFINKYGTIKTETNNIIDDGHFSEMSHYECSEFFYNIINEK